MGRSHMNEKALDASFNALQSAKVSERLVMPKNAKEASR